MQFQLQHLQSILQIGHMGSGPFNTIIFITVCQQREILNNVMQDIFMMLTFLAGYSLLPMTTELPLQGSML